MTRKKTRAAESARLSDVYRQGFDDGRDYEAKRHERYLRVLAAEREQYRAQYEAMLKHAAEMAHFRALPVVVVDASKVGPLEVRR